MSIMSSNPKDSNEITLPKEILETLEYEAEGRGLPPAKVLMEWLTDGYTLAFYDAEESVVRMKHIEPWAKDQKSTGEETREGETPTTILTYRRLREEFSPVTAGVEYHKTFTSGGGFGVQLDDADDKNQEASKKLIERLNENLFQDQVTQGLDAILDILIDEVLTVGSAAAEIVYEGYSDPDSLDVSSWLVPNSEGAKDEPQYKAKEMKEEDWKKLKGIVQLKIIDNAVERLKPYVDKTTYKIEYWTVDEREIEKYNVKAKSEGKPLKEIPRLLPWQVLWLSWARRGSDLKGKSLVKPVLAPALALEEILRAVSISFKRWSDKKYFFILGDARTGRSWAPPKIREFLKDTKKMVEKGGTGIAVPAGFDTKEIGGEAYDGGLIINQLISMIAGGMRYPRSFLEQDGKAGGIEDKSWLAWLVTYATNQKLLRRAIEHQLWKRHLYCKVGLTQKVSVQGKKVEEQDVVSVYVPNMVWKSEGKWHVQTKIEELSRILNVANPVGPELKLEVEHDIAVTLGYRDLDFEEAKDLLEITQKLCVVEAETDMVKAEMLKAAYERAMDDGIHLEMIPIIQGLKEEEPEPVARPPPVPLERLEGGVSRPTKETGEPSKRGVSRPLGGTRKPSPKTGQVRKTEESVEQPMVVFDNYKDYFETMWRKDREDDRKALFTKMIGVLDKIGGE